MVRVLDKVRRRPDSETTARIEARVDELAEHFLKEKSETIFQNHFHPLSDK